MLMFAEFGFFQRHGLSWVVGGCDAKRGDLRRNNEGHDIGLNWILTGFEPHSVSPSLPNDLRNSSCTGAAKSGAVPARPNNNDPSLARLIDAWPLLSEPIRQAILVLVERKL